SQQRHARVTGGNLVELAREARHPLLQQLEVLQVLVHPPTRGLRQIKLRQPKYPLLRPQPAWRLDRLLTQQRTDAVLDRSALGNRAAAVTDQPAPLADPDIRDVYGGHGADREQLGQLACVDAVVLALGSVDQPK